MYYILGYFMKFRWIYPDEQYFFVYDILNYFDFRGKFIISANTECFLCNMIRISF